MISLARAQVQQNKSETITAASQGRLKGLLKQEEEPRLIDDEKPLDQACAIRLLFKHSPLAPYKDLSKYLHGQWVRVKKVSEAI
mmetsp:Transcript_38383/g.58463  ORF Transcript_38383/g.58463 Transcript_38383/m.58463 type:complete len:84 (+) Transcript_38383:116-367(+)